MTLRGPRRLRLLIETATAFALCWGAVAHGQDLVYDAKVGWLSAGTLTVNLDLLGDRYELSGDVRTSGPIERFFRWRGRFAAVGDFVDDRPKTHAYLLIEDKPDRRKVTLASAGRTTIRQRGSLDREKEQPKGSDLMSVLFLTPMCFEYALVHDGEDTYDVTLTKHEPDELRQGSKHFSGPSELCRYRFTYESGDVRDVDVWLAEHEGRRVPVRVRVRVSFRPDGLLRLRWNDA